MREWLLDIVQRYFYAHVPKYGALRFSVLFDYGSVLAVIRAYAVLRTLGLWAALRITAELAVNSVFAVILP